MVKLSLEDKFKKVENNLIGLWRFKRINENTKWCATFEFKGFYYDVEGYSTPHKTLNAVYKRLEELDKNY
ncbi:hypothetical protein SAMN04488009_0169 [Maribacter sedimenticola]|uniref:Uncharacterized protein n=1 Tax=Maribacter sedimenticola TaxID=228956 RepID=A0ABY1SM96_9FLAO|nr:hypothetical protein [Maribacter sedimenticola]SNR80672.1 hypothetical protein SAMN04488009_0169 [Maribacter sedimenticola]